MNDTIAALATPSGESAIAVIRISGEACIRICRDCLGLESPEPRLAYLRQYKSVEEKTLDDVVSIYYKAPASYTGEDCLEISCHGNPFIAQNILSDLMARGVRGAHAGEFTRRAFLNDKMDLSQAEAVALVIGARSGRALRAARKQLGGGLGKKISEESGMLVDILAQVEAYIDFPDEDLPPENAKKICAECSALAGELKRLLDTTRYSAVIHGGLNVPIVGVPNAGKSSILNLMLGSERAIVSDEAGTTRDFIAEKATIGDIAVNLTDTAGLRDCAGEIEKMGMEKAIEKIGSADIILLALDASAELPALPKSATEMMTPRNTIVVQNKCDLTGISFENIESKYADFTKVKLSCKSGSGLESLKNAILKLAKENGIFPESDDALVGARHADALSRAISALHSASDKIRLGQADAFAASDLREALSALGEIVGKTDNETVLDAVFSKFCIGK